ERAPGSRRGGEALPLPRRSLHLVGLRQVLSLPDHRHAALGPARRGLRRQRGRLAVAGGGREVAERGGGAAHQLSRSRSATCSPAMSSPVIWKRRSMQPPRSTISSRAKSSTGTPRSMSFDPERLQPSTETATRAPRDTAPSTASHKEG